MFASALRAKTPHRIRRVLWSDPQEIRQKTVLIGASLPHPEPA